MDTSTRSRVVLLSLLFLVSVSLGFAQLDDFSYRLQAGTYEANQGNISAAMADLQSAVTINPNRSDGWYQLGLLLGQVSDFRGAESAFRNAIKLKSDFAQAHYSLALSLTANPKSKLDWPGAISECREALKYKPDYAEALNLLGTGLIASGETDAAIRELEHAAKLKPSFPSAHFNLAVALEKADRLDEAAKEYELAIAAKTAYPEAIAAWGKLLLRIGKTTDAEQELEKALRLNPDLADAHDLMARALQTLGKKSEAAVESDEAADLKQRESDAAQSSTLSNSSLDLAAKGDLAGATAALRKAIALKPDYGVPHYYLGLILADGGDLAGAVAELTKGISLMPSQAKPWFELGRVLRLQGEDQRALEAIHWAARLSPSDPAIHAELVSMRSPALPLPQTKDSHAEPKPKTLADIIPTLSIRQPRAGARADTAPEHITFAEQLSAQGDSLGAVGELLRALALQPNAMNARRQLAIAYRRLGDEDHAIVEYHKILIVFPEDVDAHLGLGEALLERGNAKDASAQFEIALAREPNSTEAKDALERAKKALSDH
jgi:tetratricopeptide (TPR) repeat protein